MRLLFRWVTVAGATCACLAAFAGTAAASQHLDRMLKRYQPVTVLDGHEAFAPTSVASFAADADLETQTAPNTWAVVTTSPWLRRAPDGADRGVCRPGARAVLPAEPARLHPRGWNRGSGVRSGRLARPGAAKRRLRPRHSRQADDDP